MAEATGVRARWGLEGVVRAVAGILALLLALGALLSRAPWNEDGAPTEPDYIGDQAELLDNDADRIERFVN